MELPPIQPVLKELHRKKRRSNACKISLELLPGLKSVFTFVQLLPRLSETHIEGLLRIKIEFVLFTLISSAPFPSTPL
jgi:hypothetical protein